MAQSKAIGWKEKDIEENQRPEKNKKGNSRKGKEAVEKNKTEYTRKGEIIQDWH